MSRISDANRTFASYGFALLLILAGLSWFWAYGKGGADGSGLLNWVAWVALIAGVCDAIWRIAQRHKKSDSN